VQNILNTGGPRNSRTFYLRIRIFKVQECVPNLKIHSLYLAYSWIFDGIGHKTGQKLVFLTRQCSLVIFGFIISDSLPERIYRELQGPPVCKRAIATGAGQELLKETIQCLY